MTQLDNKKNKTVQAHDFPHNVLRCKEKYTKTKSTCDCIMYCILELQDMVKKKKSINLRYDLLLVGNYNFCTTIFTAALHIWILHFADFDKILINCTDLLYLLPKTLLNSLIQSFDCVD